MNTIANWIEMLEELAADYGDDTPVRFAGWKGIGRIEEIVVVDQDDPGDRTGYEPDADMPYPVVYLVFGDHSGPLTKAVAEAAGFAE